LRAEAARAGVDAVHPAHVVLRQEGVLQRLHEVEVLDAALRTRDGLTVVREEVEPLVRVDDQLAAGGALQPLRTAGHRGEDVVAVHRAEDELGAVPDLGAGRVPTLQSAGPALQTGHADSGEVTRPPLTLHLDTRCGVLPGRNEERSINQWISFKDDHLVVAENTGNFVHLVSCIAGENEAPSLIVPNAALILHLDVIRIYLLSWKHIECTVIVPPKENAASAIVPRAISHAELSRRQLVVAPGGRVGRRSAGRSPGGGAGAGVRGGHRVGSLPRWNSLNVASLHHLQAVDESRQANSERWLAVLIALLSPSLLFLAVTVWS